MRQLRDDLVNRFFTTNAVKLAKEGEEFTLASGRKSNFYIDCRKVLAHGMGSRLAALLISEELFKLTKSEGEYERKVYIGATGVGGTLMLGSLLTLISSGDKYNGFVVRPMKDHGLKNRVEGHLPEPGDRDNNIVLIDDVLTSGGTLMEMGDVLVTQHQREPDLILTLVDRCEGGEQAIKAAFPRTPIKSIFTPVDFPYTALKQIVKDAIPLEQTPAYREAVQRKLASS